ncbi:VOC family protein [soil metagenome]
MEITQVLCGIAVADLDRSKRWYELLFGRRADAEPMPGLTEWRSSAGVVQLVLDEQRAGGSLVTLQVVDVRAAVTDLASCGGPAVQVDDTTSDKVWFAEIDDPDGNGVTVVEVRPGVQL